MSFEGRDDVRERSALRSKYLRIFKGRFGTVLREGADRTNPPLVLEFVTDLLGLWMLALNALLSLVLLPWSSRRGKGLLQQQRQARTEPIRVLLDSKFRYADMDSEFCELLGLSKAELIGKDAEYVTPIDFCNISEFRKQVRLIGKKDGFWMYRRVDGNLVLVHYSIEIRRDNMADLLVTPVTRREAGKSVLSSDYGLQTEMRDHDRSTKR